VHPQGARNGIRARLPKRLPVMLILLCLTAVLCPGLGSRQANRELVGMAKRTNRVAWGLALAVLVLVLSAIIQNRVASLLANARNSCVATSVAPSSS
jgi:hypothetical protein